MVSMRSAVTKGPTLSTLFPLYVLDNEQAGKGTVPRRQVFNKSSESQNIQTKQRARLLSLITMLSGACCNFNMELPTALMPGANRLRGMSPTSLLADIGRSFLGLRGTSSGSRRLCSWRTVGSPRTFAGIVRLAV